MALNTNHLVTALVTPGQYAVLQANTGKQFPQLTGAVKRECPALIVTELRCVAVIIVDAHGVDAIHGLHFDQGRQALVDRMGELLQGGVIAEVVGLD